MADHSAFPPEVTSALIYAGPGSTSYMTAASSWNAVSAELQSYGAGLENVINELSDQEWWGPSSAKVAASFGPFIQWAKTTASQVERHSVSATTAAAAYEQVFGSVVPPPVIATNRVQLANAVSSNLLGQNNNRISKLESQYNQYWAQNATAMNAYDTQSKNATTNLQTVQEAPSVSEGDGGQTAADTATATSSAGTAGKTATNAAAQAPVTPAAATTATQPGSELWFLLTGQTAFPTNLSAFVNGLSPFAGFAYNTEGLPYFSVGMGNSGVQIAKSTGALGGAAASAASAAPKGLSGLGGMLGGGAAPSVAAGLGNAASVGKLAVPAAWNAAVPGLAHAAPVAVNTVSALPEATGAGGNLMGGMPLAGMGTSGATSTGPRYGFRPTVMARPPFAG